MALERSLWQWLRGAERVLRDRLHWTRIENLTGAGTPDVEGCFDGGQFWLELKSSARPKRDTTPIRFRTKGREAQRDWLEKRSRMAHNAFYLLQVGEGRTASRYLLPGVYGQLIHEGMTEEQLGEATVLPDIAPYPTMVVEGAVA